MSNKLNYAQPLPDARFSLIAIAAIITSIALPLSIAAIGVKQITTALDPIPAGYIKIGIIVVPPLISGLLSILALLSIRYSAGELTGRGMAKAALVVSLLWLFLQGSIVFVGKYVARQHGF